MSPSFILSYRFLSSVANLLLFFDGVNLETVLKFIKTLFTPGKIFYKNCNFSLGVLGFRQTNIQNKPEFMLDMDTNEMKMEELLPAYFNGELDAGQVKAVEEWISAGSENAEIAKKVCMVHQIGKSVAVMKSVDTDAALRKVYGNIRRNSFRRFLASMQRAAAILLLPVLAAGGYFCFKYYTDEDESVNEQVELKTTAGMVSSAVLPDGSRVWLNSNSSLTYPVRFSGDERKVFLSGEAYFDVKSDNGKKFIVSTSSMDVEVLGTEFNVDAYGEDGRDVRTALVSGSVRMSYADTSGVRHIVRLSPGQMIVYDPDSDAVACMGINTETVTSWKDGRIVLDNTSLADALRMIENRYNVRFMITNGDLLQNRYTGVFDSQRLDTVLEHFRRTTRIHFKRDYADDGEYEITERETILVY